jgi:hypothetical protein
LNAPHETPISAPPRTPSSPVPLDPTIEIMAFMEAADESKRRGGVPVKLQDVMDQAERAR